MMINSCITSNVSQPIATAPSGVAEADFVVPLNLSLKLSQIQNSPDFTKTDADLFKYSRVSGVDLKIYRYNFLSLKDAEFFVQNRKLRLHQSFQNNIAPYFGVVELNQNCLKQARLEAIDQKIDSDTTKFFMEFPVTNRRVVSDCVRDNASDIIHYEFYLCLKKNQVYELRTYRELTDSVPHFQISCG